MMDQVDKTIRTVLATMANNGGIRHIVWVAAGGSFGGFYPAQYFMTHESTQVSSEMFTSNEFVLATPKYVNRQTLAVFCSMRGTAETCEAAEKAAALGAETIGLYVQESKLTAVCDHLIQYESIAVDESRTERVNSSVGLMLAMDVVDQTEGYDEFERAMDTFSHVDTIYRDAVVEITPSAHEWAAKNADRNPIYVLGSGPAYGSAYIFSICNIEEMLQIDSPTINSCEYFHGPFETLDAHTSIFQLVSVGRTRAADERVVKFLKKYDGNRAYVLDGRQIGLAKIDDRVAEYFNHILFSPILNNVYMRALSRVTGKDYNTRQYMWKTKY